MKVLKVMAIVLAVCLLAWNTFVIFGVHNILIQGVGDLIDTGDVAACIEHTFWDLVRWNDYLIYISTFGLIEL